MTSNIVTSPCGESIEIVPDDEWLTLTGGAPKHLRGWNLGGKRFVITELLWHGAVVDEVSGRAGSILWDRMRDTFGDDITTNPSSFTGLIRDPMNAPAFEVDIRVKRNHAIKLIALPVVWYKRAMQMINEYDTSPIDPEPEPIPEAEPGEVVVDATVDLITAAELAGTTDQEFAEMIRDMTLDAPTVYDELAPPLDISIASQVAMSLLTTVVEIITAGSGAAVDEKVRKLQGDLNDVMGKLSQRLEDNDRMRRQLRQAGDEIQALRHERDGLRSRLRATEANLTAALKGDAVQAINGEIQKRVDAIMRVSPKSKGDE